MLTQRQELFCLAYIETRNASEAYRRAYNAGKMKPATVNKRASELLEDGEITGRIEKLRASAREAALLSLEGHLNDLEKLRNEAQNLGQMSAAINAEIARGKASGLYTTNMKQEITAEVSKEESKPYDLSRLTEEELETYAALTRKIYL